MRFSFPKIRSLFKISLQWVLIIPFLFQIFGTVGLVGYLSFQSGREAVETLAAEVINDTNDVVAEHLSSYLEMPQKLTQMNADAIRRGVLDLKDHERSAHYFWDQMQLYDLTYNGIGMIDGSGYGIARYDGQTATLEEWTGDTKDNIVTYALDAQGNPDEVLGVWTWSNFEESWYTNPINAGKPIWSIVETYLEQGGSVVFASASRPIYDPQGKLLGMLAADVQLLKLSDFLENLHIGQSGSVFIVERDGRLIANSGGISPFIVKPDHSTERFLASASPELLVQQVSQTIQEQFGGFHNLDQATELRLKFEGEPYFVSVHPWQEANGLDWLVAVAVPESEFLAEINANRSNTIALCLLALGAATGFGFATTRWIIHPILQLNQASSAIATGNLEQTVQGSPILELDGLTESFNYMAGQLRDSFTALEASKEQLEDRVNDRTAELKATLIELRNTQAQVIQNEKMSSLGQLVAGIAHEINNPVNFIYGNLSHTEAYVKDLLGLVKLYEQQYPEPNPAIEAEAEAIDWDFIQTDLPQMLTSMQTGTERIRAIVLSLRNFSRTDESALKTVDLHEGIDSTLMILKHRLKAQSERPAIEVVKNYGLTASIECYPGPLNQVFMNIISNAIDALEERAEQQTPEERECKPGIMTIRTRFVDDQWAEVAIADNGLGIPDDL
ncbi:MAG: HAMP domain-containing protein, partial [Spirulina sp. SIO3F2]|nr:HAMP domain-containing protein [Spirulina sp. SIO3F2]